MKSILTLHWLTSRQSILSLLWQVWTLMVHSTGELILHLRICLGFLSISPAAVWRLVCCSVIHLVAHSRVHQMSSPITLLTIWRTCQVGMALIHLPSLGIPMIWRLIGLTTSRLTISTISTIQRLRVQVPTLRLHSLQQMVLLSLGHRISM